MNAVSSRSHSVFTLHLTGTNTKMGSVLHGQLYVPPTPPPFHLIPSFVRSLSPALLVHQRQPPPHSYLNTPT